MVASGVASVETQTYRLTLRGKPVGTHVLMERAQGRTLHLEGALSLSGSLRNRYLSFAFREITESRSESRTFDVDFDHGSGLVRASRGSRDRAEIPYLRPLRDPLSMLREVRSLDSEVEQQRIPMLGKDVVATFAGTMDMDTIFGPRTGRVFHLHPGGSYVIVDAEPPHAILRLTQRLDEHRIDATLVKVDHGGEMTSWSEGESRSSGGDGGGSKGKRRRRKRRRRSKKRS